MTELSPREAAFCREYVLNGRNGKEAAIKAGYSDTSGGAKVAAFKLLKRPHVIAAIKRLEAEAVKRTGTVSRLLTDANQPPPRALVRQMDRETDADSVATLTRAYVLAGLIDNFEVSLGRKPWRVEKVEVKPGELVDKLHFAHNAHAANQCAVLLLAAAADAPTGVGAAPESSNAVLLARLSSFS